MRALPIMAALLLLGAAGCERAQAAPATESPKVVVAPVVSEMDRATADIEVATRAIAKHDWHAAGTALAKAQDHLSRAPRSAATEQCLFEVALLRGQVNVQMLR